MHEKCAILLGSHIRYTANPNRMESHSVPMTNHRNEYTQIANEINHEKWQKPPNGNTEIRSHEI